MRHALSWALLGLAVAAGNGRADTPARLAGIVLPPGTGADTPPGPTVSPASGQWRRAAPQGQGAPPCPCPPQQPWAPPGTATPPQPGTSPPSTDPNAPQNPVSNLQNPFAQASEAGGEGARTFNQNFFGDFAGVFATVNVTITPPATTQIVTSPTRTTTVIAGVIVTQAQTNLIRVQPTPIVRQVRVLEASRYNGVQVVDNDSPRPTDRVYFSYNYYDQAGASLNPTTGGYNVQREVAGFEKTFFGGDASFGMRLPFVQTNGFAINSKQVGDLTLLLKTAWINDRRTGDVFATGFILTAPTGGSSTLGVPGLTDLALASLGLQGVNPASVQVSALPDLPHSCLMQPWVGGIKVFDRFYAQAVTNVIVPTDHRDPTVLGNSIGVGYWLYRNPESRYLTGIIPTFEVHVRTPLNDRDPNGLIYLQDQVNLNCGLHLRTRRAIFSTAVCVPTVGPKPWNIEAIGMVNYLF